ncbi:ferredoxin [candidate division WOR-3 bacterium JGI_Cruoil_03_44_89]|uniref:Ferredoxin n=1 Tax=candidate division WOR-3 bacterium JGI_Cruoil_03_44_89 TaxID=1973748 RepID=A0A235BQY0_UNCW3|nr:MAG: ferredoxin [candidate division WOR-3 bacterium JGI_Cruoil_03_44_89]
MRIKIDEELCTGCEVCVDTCPNLFEVGENGIAVVIVDEVPKNEEECAKEAADNCPSEAIIIEK